ncbi:MAG: hypothetical protein HYR48_02090, partial [Gemmatimonadetes bacterium]|nr:hypothetical protein [Gemmatimonadota bacterium]
TLDALGIIMDSVLKAGPSAVELLDRTYLEFARATGARIPAGSEAALLVELDDEGGFQVLGLLGVGEGVVVASSPEETARIWELRHLASPILAALPDNQRSLQVVEDGCVPRERLGDYISALRRVAAAHGFQVVIFGHAGDGHVHANLLADVGAPDVVERVSACFVEVSMLQLAHHGTLSGEHGDGRLRAPLLQPLLGRSFLDVCRRVKAAFDPAGILNPGVKIPEAPARVELAPELLKFGARAPALPREVAEVLRRIERDAAWGTFRLDLAPEAAPAHP